jgi:hypothetical protein
LNPLLRDNSQNCIELSCGVCQMHSGDFLLSSELLRGNGVSVSVPVSVSVEDTALPPPTSLPAVETAGGGVWSHVDKLLINQLKNHPSNITQPFFISIRDFELKSICAQRGVVRCLEVPFSTKMLVYPSIVPCSLRTPDYSADIFLSPIKMSVCVEVLTHTHTDTHTHNDICIVFCIYCQDIPFKSLSFFLTSLSKSAPPLFVLLL